MPLIGADGLPLDPQKRQEALPADQGGNVLGYIIVKVNPGGTCVPLMDSQNGTMAVIGDPQAAAQHASQLANKELIPSKEQKVVTPAQVSSLYMVLKLVGVAHIQAKLKDPQQLLAPGGKLHG